MPVNKVVRYEFMSFHEGAQQFYTEQEMAEAMGVKVGELHALLRCGEFSYHITERNQRGKLEYFWRVDGRDGNSFKRNVAKWKRMKEAKRAQLLKIGRKALREYRKRDNDWLIHQDYDDS